MRNELGSWVRFSNSSMPISSLGLVTPSEDMTAQISLIVKLLTFVAVPFVVQAADGEKWSVVRNEHFEVFSQAGAESARVALRRLEQLRLFVAGTGLRTEQERPIRVIGFRSRQEYEGYQLRPLADAFYLGSWERDYLVVPSLEPGKFSMVAHEYVHSVLHTNGFELPLWLGEGLAEYYSNGRAIPQIRYESLRGHEWIPLPDLLHREIASRDNDRETASLFYAESAALVNMLAESWKYRPHFAQVILSLNAGGGSLEEVTGRSVDQISQDLLQWVAAGQSRALFLPELPVAIRENGSELSESEAGLVLADLKDAEAAAKGTAPPMPVDEAYYIRALSAFNAGSYQEALGEVRLVKVLGEDRAFNYWVITAFGLLDLGHLQEAAAAAEHATRCARTAEERGEATELWVILESHTADQVLHDRRVRLR